MRTIKIFLFGCFIILDSCNHYPKEYLTIAGHIENKKDSTFSVVNGKINKIISIDENGNFKDTLKVTEKGNFFLIHNEQRTPIYLDNGFDLKIEADANQWNYNIKYEGYGSDNINLLNAQYSFAAKSGNPNEWFTLEKEEFQKKIENLKFGIDSILKLYTNLDPTLSENIKNSNQKFFNQLTVTYERQHSKAIELKKMQGRIEKGSPSPEFNNYKSFFGKTKSLKDFRGKYVYIDLWATWCKPCIAQFPSLEQLKKEYTGKNIHIISIGTDNERTAKSKENAEKLWRRMVKEKNLKGIQLFATDEQFMIDYVVNSIPRFILLDPEGKIVNNNAPRPFDPELKKLFSSLGI